MNRDQTVRERIDSIIIEELCVDAVKPDSMFYEDLAADSLDVAGLIIACEQAFSIEIDDDAQPHQVSELYELVEAKISK